MTLRSCLEAVVLLFEMYPNEEIYFLARDAELLYDTAKILSKGNAKIAKRLHLLNISRANMRAKNVKEYLAQEGISEAALKAGKKVLFVDTGFSVFQVEDKNGKVFALKVAKSGDPEAILSLAKETEKISALKNYKLLHAIIIESGTGFVLKEWIDGTRADAWLAKWQSAGAPLADPAVKSLHKLLKQSANSGVYVGDLNPKNLIWNGSAWIIVDSGSVRSDLSLDEILSRYKEKMTTRWGKIVSCPSLFSNL